MKKRSILSKFTGPVILLISIALLSVNIKPGFAQIPDWSTTIAAILYDHCTHCHHEGAIAPFSLMTYEETAAWGPSILTQINAGIMPPWPPDPDYNHLMNENVLSEEEINAINLWVDNDMPTGDLNLAPPQPAYNGLSIMLDPDEVIQLPVFSMPTVENVYWRFVNQSGYTENKFINSMEFVGGNSAIIHHATVGYDLSGLAWQDDQNYPGPGCPRTFGENPAVNIFMGQSEGRLVKLPSNIGFEIPAGSDYVSDMHYFANAVGETDSSKINLKFCTAGDVRVVNADKTLYGDEPCLLDGPLEIPANTVRTFHLKSSQFTTDKSLVGLGPHSHQVCIIWKAFMVTPSGDTVPLIKIPNWDFNWQGVYLLTKVLKIPAGSHIFGEVTYDNTINNPNNPSNPPEDVYGNASSLGEMAQLHTWMMDYEPGDEDIILDSAFYGFPTPAVSINRGNLLEVYPNPVSGSATVSFSLSKASLVTLELKDVSGRSLSVIASENFSMGNHRVTMHCKQFTSGIYLLQLSSGEGVMMKKLVFD